MSSLKYQLLSRDYIDIKHPIDKSHTRLYRIIAMRDIAPDIPNGTIGGYIKSVANLDAEDESWVENEAKIFDNAHLSGNSRFSGKSSAYGDARIVNTTAKDTVRVYGSAQVYDSKLSENVDIFGEVKVSDSVIKNASKIFGRCKINNSNVEKGAVVHGDATLDKCLLTDVSEARGNCNLFNVQMFERAIVESGTHKNCSFSRSIDLSITQQVVSD